ncbi:hypothetical protein [Sinosporangium siamense]|uniref:Uncharacterized protein n=1 Tax=Sinosporangium siamense TaxID=1367973 RepID=A0A919RRS0_9ACTN|nr:hypothetical protein [Sinosporangium siamense]GII97544.1 hypothetical protein Ssi02_77750 [Sinosporangium siamense]
MSICAHRLACEEETRHQRLAMLRHALQQQGHPSTLVRHRHGRWSLKSGGQTVYCGGADGVYAYITQHGLILVPADDDNLAHAVQRLIDGHLR